MAYATTLLRVLSTSTITTSSIHMPARQLFMSTGNRRERLCLAGGHICPNRPVYGIVETFIDYNLYHNSSLINFMSVPCVYHAICDQTTMRCSSHSARQQLKPSLNQEQLKRMKQVTEHIPDVNDWVCAPVAQVGFFRIEP